MKFNNLFDKLKEYRNNISYCKSVVQKLPKNEVIVKEILEIIDNKYTKVVEENIKNNYYFYLNDTIYLSNKEKSKNNYGRVLVIAHECIHSIQSKLIQKLNFILSNIELLLFFIIIILSIFNINNIIIKIVYILSNILSIIFRLILETDAVSKSFSLANKYLTNKLKQEDYNILKKLYKVQLNLLIIPFIIGLTFFKVIRLVIVVYFL